MSTHEAPPPGPKTGKPSHTDKLVLTPKEAAALAGISVTTLYDLWAADKGPPSFKIGKARRLLREDLIAWLVAKVRK